MIHPVIQITAKGKPQSPHRKRVKTLDWSPDGRYVVSGSDDTRLIVWDTESGQPVKTLTEYCYYISGAAWGADSRQIVTCSIQKTLNVWDREQGGEVTIYQPAEPRCSHFYSVAWSRDGKYIAGGTNDRIIVVIHVKARHVEHVFLENTGQSFGTISFVTDSHPMTGIHAVTFSPDRDFLAAGSSEGYVPIWNMLTVTLFARLQHGSQINALAWSPNGQYLASGADDGKLKIWDVQSQHLLQSMSGHRSMIEAVAWSANGDYVFSASYDNTFKVWHLKTKTCVATFEARHSLCSGAISPDNRSAVVGDSEGNVYFLSIEGI